jgi:Fis family transcriptional regulator
VVIERTEARQREQQPGTLTVFQANRTEPLGECVRRAIKYYLRNLGGHEVNDLHEIVLGEVERPLIETVLDYTQGNQTHAARLLGMSRSTLRKMIAQYGIRQQD